MFADRGISRPMLSYPNVYLLPFELRFQVQSESCYLCRFSSPYVFLDASCRLPDLTLELRNEVIRRLCVRNKGLSGSSLVAWSVMSYHAQGCAAGKFSAFQDWWELEIPSSQKLGSWIKFLIRNTFRIWKKQQKASSVQRKTSARRALARFALRSSQVAFSGKAGNRFELEHGNISHIGLALWPESLDQVIWFKMQG